jgi:hypothetical protein
MGIVRSALAVERAVQNTARSMYCTRYCRSVLSRKALWGWRRQSVTTTIAALWPSPIPFVCAPQFAWPGALQKEQCGGTGGRCHLGGCAASAGREMRRRFKLRVHVIDQLPSSRAHFTCKTLRGCLSPRPSIALHYGTLQWHAIPHWS